MNIRWSVLFALKHKGFSNKAHLKVITIIAIFNLQIKIS